MSMPSVCCRGCVKYFRRGPVYCGSQRMTSSTCSIHSFLQQLSGQLIRGKRLPANWENSLIGVNRTVGMVSIGAGRRPSNTWSGAPARSAETLPTSRLDPPAPSASPARLLPQATMLVYLARALAIRAIDVGRMQDVGANRVLDIELADMGINDHPARSRREGVGPASLLPATHAGNGKGAALGSRRPFLTYPRCGRGRVKSSAQAILCRDEGETIKARSIRESHRLPPTQRYQCCSSQLQSDRCY